MKNTKLTAWSLALAMALSAAACAPRTSVKRGKFVTATKTERVKTKYTGPKRRIGVVDFDLG